MKKADRTWVYASMYMFRLAADYGIRILLCCSDSFQAESCYALQSHYTHYIRTSSYYSCEITLASQQNS